MGGTFVYGDDGAFKKKGNPFECNTLEDARKAKSIGVSLNFADHLFLEERGFTNLVINRDPKNTGNLKLLIYDRVEMISSQKERVYITANRYRVDPSLVEETNCVLFKTSNSIAFSRGTSDSLIQRWQRELDTMHQEGISGRLVSLAKEQAGKDFDF